MIREGLGDRQTSVWMDLFHACITGLDAWKRMSYPKMKDSWVSRFSFALCLGRGIESHRPTVHFFE